MLKILFCLLFFLNFPVWREYKVSEKLDREEVSLDETFSLQIDIEYKDKKPKDISLPGISSLKDFYLLDKSSGFQSQITIINGRSEITKINSYEYLLQPKTKGTYSFEGLKVRIEDKPYDADPGKSIKVTEKSKSPHLSPSIPPVFLFPQQPLKDFFNSSLPQDRRPQGDVQLKLQLKKTAYYVGEMIEARWVIFSSSPRIQSYPYNRPVLRDFLQEELLPNSQPRFLGTEVLNKVLYRKTLFDFRALFPIKAGVLEVDSYDVKISDLSFFGPSGGRIKSFPSRMIRVKPLPEIENNFAGAVGRFKGEAWLEQTESPVNQPVTFRLRISGQGHPQLIKLPKIPFPSSFQVYPAVENIKFSGLKDSYKEFEILLIPKVQGEWSIPEFQFTTFESEKGAYISHTILPLSLNVLPGAAKLESETEKFFIINRQSSKKTFNFKPKRGLWLFSHKRLVYLWIGFYSLLCLILLSVCVFPVLFKRRPPSFKKKILHQLVRAKQSAKKGLFEQTSLQLIKLLHEAVFLLSMETVSKKTDPVSILPPLLRERDGIVLKELIEALEAAAYSKDKGGRSPDKMQDLIRRTEQLIKQWFRDIRI